MQVYAWGSDPFNRTNFKLLGDLMFEEGMLVCREMMENQTFIDYCIPSNNPFGYCIPSNNLLDIVFEIRIF